MYVVFAVKNACNAPEYKGCNLFIDTCTSATWYDTTMTVYEFDPETRAVLEDKVVAQNW